MWKCKKCSEEIEDSFDSCWNCGVGKDGTMPKNAQEYRAMKEATRKEVVNGKGEQKMAEQSNSTATKTKPLGIILVVFYFAIVFTFLGLLNGTSTLLLMSVLPAVWGLYCIVSVAISVLSIAACYGLWVLVDWGRSLAVAICVIDIPLSLISLKMPGILVTSGILLWVVVTISLEIVIIWYLSKSKVRSLFSKPRG
jgi:hypothetical protein